MVYMTNHCLKCGGTLHSGIPVLVIKPCPLCLSSTAQFKSWSQLLLNSGPAKWNYLHLGQFPAELLVEFQDIRVGPDLLWVKVQDS